MQIEKKAKKIEGKTKNDFHELLRVNTIKNTDELIFGNLAIELDKICKKLKIDGEKENINKIEQIQHRKSKLSTLFVSYDNNMEIIQQYKLRKRYVAKEEMKCENEVDAELQEVIINIGDRLHEKLYDKRQRVQILERTVGIYELLNHFDEYMQVIETKNIDKKDRIIE